MPSTNNTENVRRYRARKKTEVETSVKWAIAAFIGGDDDREPITPGSRILLTELYAFAVDLLDAVVDEYDDEVRTPDPRSGSAFLSPQERREEWAERAEDESLPLRPRRAPSRIAFYRVASDMLGAPTRRNDGSRYYTVPEDAMNQTIFTREEILAEVARQEREAHATPRTERASSDDNVVEFRRRTA